MDQSPSNRLLHLDGDWIVVVIGLYFYNFKNSCSLTELIISHYEEILSFYGNELGLKVARKHLGWYMQYDGVLSEDRRSILTEEFPKQVISKLKTVFECREAA